MSKMSYVQDEVQLSDEVEESAALQHSPPEESAAIMSHTHALMRRSRVMLLWHMKYAACTYDACSYDTEKKTNGPSCAAWSDARGGQQHRRRLHRRHHTGCPRHTPTPQVPHLWNVETGEWDYRDILHTGWITGQMHKIEHIMHKSIRANS